MDNFVFSKAMKKYFGASLGAGSRVTGPDEAKKKQLTVTKAAERPVVTSIYTDIPKGKKADLGDSCMYSYKLFPTGETITLPTLFRPDGQDGQKRDELRIYMHKGIFFPEEGTMWFVYVRDKQLWIGALSDEELSYIDRGGAIDKFDGLIQNQEYTFQSELNENTPPILRKTNLVGYQRNPKVAFEAMKHSGHICELMPEFPVFISKVSGKPYLEAHHFLPMNYQRHLPDINIDVVDNICILNPFAHRMIHHAKFSEIEKHIENLGKKREKFLAKIEMDINRLKEIYSGLAK